MMRVWLSVVLLAVFAGEVQAGQVVVRKSSEPFDAFAVRDQVQRDFEWRESLRLQQQIQILQSLPLGCVLFKHPYAYYRCDASFYRPYLYQKGNNPSQQLYIQVDPPAIE